MMHTPSIFLIAPALALGIIGGVVSAHASAFGVALAALYGLLGVALALLAVVSRDAMFRARGLLLAVALLSAGIGALRFVADDTPAHPALARAVGSAVIVEGVVVEDPDRRADVAYLIVAAESLRESGGAVAASGRIRVSVPRYPEYRYGDRLRIKGTLEKPEAFLDEATGRMIAFDRMLRAQDIRFALRAADVVRIAADAGNPIVAVLSDTKHALLLRTARVIDEPAFAFLAGATLGEKGGLGNAWRERFARTGLSHVVVLSGYNMTIVADWIGKALAWAWPSVRISGGITAIALFAVMAGGGAATVRAAIMAAIVLVARTRGKEDVATRALLYAAAAMVLVSPRIALDDLGFQLSFLASLGLIHLAGPLEQLLSFIRLRWIREVAATTLAAQIAVLPLILGKMGIFSLIAPIANIAVLPFIPFAMIATFATALCAFLVPPLAFVPALVAQTLAEGMLALVSLFSALPFAAVRVPEIPSALVAIFSAGLCVAVIRAGSRVRSRQAPRSN